MGLLVLNWNQKTARTKFRIQLHLLGASEGLWFCVLKTGLSLLTSPDSSERIRALELLLEGISPVLPLPSPLARKARSEAEFYGAGGSQGTSNGIMRECD